MARRWLLSAAGWEQLPVGLVQVPALDADLYVPTLLQSILGSER